MGYDRGDSFPFDFEPNGFPFGSKLKGKLSPRSDPIQFERKWNTSFLSATQLFVQHFSATVRGNQLNGELSGWQFRIVSFQQLHKKLRSILWL